VRVAKPGMAAADTVSAFGGPVAYGPSEQYKGVARKFNMSNKAAAPRYGGGGSYSSSLTPQARPSGMHSLQAYNAYGQRYGGAPQQFSSMVGTRPSYVDPATGMTRSRFVGRDSAFSNVAVPRYTFMGQAPGTPMSFVGGR